jgi:ABC-type microcin C transport system permease subunit YejE
MEDEKDISFSFSRFAAKQFRKNKAAMWSFRLLILLIVIALLAPLIANDKPLYCKYKGTTMFPAFSFNGRTEIASEKIQYDIADWKRMDMESVCWPLCTYSPNKSDFDNADYISPGGVQFQCQQDFVTGWEQTKKAKMFYRD